MEIYITLINFFLKDNTHTHLHMKYLLIFLHGIVIYNLYLYETFFNFFVRYIITLLFIYIFFSDLPAQPV